MSKSVIDNYISFMKDVERSYFKIKELTKDDSIDIKTLVKILDASEGIEKALKENRKSIVNTLKEQGITTKVLHVD